MDRSELGYYLSAFQSAVFNAVLDARLGEGALATLRDEARNLDLVDYLDDGDEAHFFQPDDFVEGVLEELKFGRSADHPRFQSLHAPGCDPKFAGSGPFNDVGFYLVLGAFDG